MIRYGCSSGTPKKYQLSEMPKSARTTTMPKNHFRTLLKCASQSVSGDEVIGNINSVMAYMVQTYKAINRNSKMFQLPIAAKSQNAHHVCKYRKTRNTAHNSTTGSRFGLRIRRLMPRSAKVY